MRRWRAFAAVALVVGGGTLLALARMGPDALGDYRALAAHKTLETLAADPVFLLGPTLLHASRWFVGSPMPGIALQVVLLVVLLAIWRRGLAEDADGRLLQFALVPLVAVLAAPYALVYELSAWLASFWLLWRFTDARPADRALLLWLAAPVWACANLGVALPREGGADLAAIFGLVLAGWVVLRFIRRPTTSSARTPLPAAQPRETPLTLQPVRRALPR
jgi:hypothetical protein